MKTSIELKLRTREVARLFERKISGDRLFIDAILHKVNIVLNHCKKQDNQAMETLSKMAKNLTILTQYFNAHNERFSNLLAKKKEIDDAKINVIAQFNQNIIITNPLALQLVEFIEVYDKLMATLKLLHLMGCFESNDIYFENIRRYQKIANRGLSELLLGTFCQISSDSTI